MTNCPALRRHIYANLGARVENVPPPRTYEFTLALPPPLSFVSRRRLLGPDVENSVNYGFRDERARARMLASRPSLASSFDLEKRLFCFVRIDREFESLDSDYGFKMENNNRCLKGQSAIQSCRERDLEILRRVVACRIKQ